MATKSKKKTKAKKLRPNGAVDGIPAPSPFDVLTLEQAAAYLQLPVDDVRTEAASGRLPGRFVSETWRFSRDALLTWLSNPARPSLADWFRDHSPRPWSPVVEREAEAEIAELYAPRRSLGIEGNILETGDEK